MNNLLLSFIALASISSFAADEVNVKCVSTEKSQSIISKTTKTSLKSLSTMLNAVDDSLLFNELCSSRKYNNQECLNFSFQRHAQLNNIDGMKALREMGAIVKSDDIYAGSTLSGAVMKERYDIVRLLIEAGANVNTPEYMGYTHERPGHTALYHADNYEMAKLLLDAGANVNSKNVKGQTPLMGAMSGYLDGVSLVKLLVEAGANLDDYVDFWGTPFQLNNQNVEVADYLLSKGADINSTNMWGKTLLMNGQISYELAEFLIEKGADIEARDKSGRGLKYYYSKNGRDDLLKLLE